jgi:16S rRNA processing protein RimM
MDWTSMAVVGRIARPHGVRGQIVVNPETDFPEERFRPGAELFIERRGGVESVTITSLRFQKNRPVVALAGVESVDAARALAGLELRVPASQLVRLPAGSFYHHDLVGCRVQTRSGEEVGTVRDVEGDQGSKRLVVRSARGDVLIPLAREICTSIDPAARLIVVDPPQGLLELNR